MDQPDSLSTSPSLLRALRTPLVDEAAWKRFLACYQPRIERWCRQAGLQAADVDEVQARVLASLVSALRTFDYDPVHRFRGWLRTVVQNALRSYWRERCHKPGAQGSGDDLERLEQIAISDPMPQLAEELDDHVHQVLQLADRILARVEQRVAPHTWQAYWRTAIEGQAPADVAEQLGMPVASVYVATNRVAKKLRQEGERLQIAGRPG